MIEIKTPHGPARAHLHAVTALGPRSSSVTARVGESARPTSSPLAGRAEAGVSVVLVEQPYRVAGSTLPGSRAPTRHRVGRGRRAAPRRSVARLPLLAGGRSSGARVACRTAATTGAIGVLCLAFPLQPPLAQAELKTRQPELDAVTVPVLVIQGERDPFGMPAAPPNGRSSRWRATTACGRTGPPSPPPPRAGSTSSSADGGVRLEADTRGFRESGVSGFSRTPVRRVRPKHPHGVRVWEMSARRRDRPEDLVGARSRARRRDRRRTTPTARRPAPGPRSRSTPGASRWPPRARCRGRRGSPRLPARPAMTSCPAPRATRRPVREAVHRA